jgi:phospholipid/cholesterol/gamma-HCH transport system substrate-binding protein
MPLTSFFEPTFLPHSIMKQNLETKVGLFLMFGIAVICTLIICFGAVGDLFKPTYTLTLTFPDASGLLKGSEVYLSGAEIGKVTTDPQPIPDSQQVEVKLKIDNKVRIRTDAIYTIGSAGLLGDRYVEVTPHEYPPNTPEGDRKPFVTSGGAPIQGAQTPSIDSLTAAAQPLIIKANAIADQISDMITKLNTQILSGTSTEDIKATIIQLRSLVKNANDMVQNGTVMIKNGNDVLVDVKDSKGPLGLAINDRESAERLKATLKNLEDLSANLKEHGVLFYSNTNDSSDKKKK